MAQIKMMATATRLKPFGIKPAEPELMLILFASMHHAKEQDWGQEFRSAMAAIWKKYNYDHAHDATLMASILKELAGADKLRAMKLAPAPNNNKANAVINYRSILQNANGRWDGKSSCPDSASEWSDSSQEKSLSVKHHRDKKTEWKEQQK